MPEAPPQLPSLVAVSVSGELARLSPVPAAFAREPWILGVLSFEVERTGRRVTGRMRAAITGKPATASTPLTPGEAVHIFVLRQGAAPDLPDVPVPYVGGGALGGCALFLDGNPLTVALLEGRYAYDHPPPRATAQVYCRWLRGGELELGCEVTDFASGGKGPKLVSRFVENRGVLSFAQLGS